MMPLAEDDCYWYHLHAHVHSKTTNKDLRTCKCTIQLKTPVKVLSQGSKTKHEANVVFTHKNRSEKDLILEYCIVISTPLVSEEWLHLVNIV